MMGGKKADDAAILNFHPFSGDGKPGGERMKEPVDLSVTGADGAAIERTPSFSGDGKPFGGGRRKGSVDLNVSKEEKTPKKEEGPAKVGTSSQGEAAGGGGGLDQMSFFITGPETPAKQQLEFHLKEMDGKILSPVLCCQCPHICFESVNDEPTSTQKSYSLEKSQKMKVCRGLSFDHLDEDEETDVRQNNHQLFVCPADSSELIPLGSYAQSRRGEMVIEVATPRTFSKHWSRTTNAEFKVIIKESYIVLKTIHSLGFCLQGKFDVNSFVADFTKGVADVKINVPYGILTKSTPAGLELDTKAFIYTVRREIFVTAPVPHDMNYWLSLISSNEFEGLHISHLAMKEDQPALGEFISMYDRFSRMEITNNEEFEKILEALDIYKDWADELSNEYFEDTISFVKARNKDESHKDGGYPKNVFGLLKLVRDCKNHKGLKLFDQFILIVAQEYPNLLYNFQEVMFARGHYKPLRLLNK